jgi:hypothetical protein
MCRLAVGIVMPFAVIGGVAIADYADDTTRSVSAYPSPAGVTLLHSRDRSFVWSIDDLGDPANGDHLEVAILLTYSVDFTPGRKISPDDAKIDAFWKADAELFGPRLAIEPSTKRVHVAVDAANAQGELSADESTTSPRLSVSLRAGRQTNDIRRGPSAEISGQRFVGHHTFASPKWEGNKFHLHAFYVADGDKISAYNVFLRRSR